MSDYKVNASGMSFDLIMADANDYTAEFKIEPVDNYFLAKQAFAGSNGGITVTYNGELIDSYPEYTKLTSVRDDLVSLVFVMSKEYNDSEALVELAGSRVTVVEAKARRGTVETMATNLDDEDALDNLWVFPNYQVRHAYAVGDRFVYSGDLYKVIQAHTSQADWIPSETPSLYVKVADPSIEWPEWVQPTGAHDAYEVGAKVSHNGKHWVNTTAANVYEPGVYGWDEAA